MTSHDDEIRYHENWLRAENATDTIRDIETRLASVLTTDELDLYIQWRNDQRDHAESIVNQLAYLDDRARVREALALEDAAHTGVDDSE